MMDYSDFIEQGPYELPEYLEGELIIRIVMQLTGKSREEVEAMKARRAVEDLDWPDEIPG